MSRLPYPAACVIALALVSCPGDTVVNPVVEWIAFRPLQCGNNPWSAAHSGPPEPDPVDEIGVIADFFAGKGIELTWLGLLEEAQGVCLACNCPRGDLLVARTAAGDAFRLAREFGFSFLVEVSGGLWLSRMPVQCGENPWDEVSPFDPAAEAREVKRWAFGEGAEIDLAGSVFPTRAMGTCLACTCPRGDLLLVSAASVEDAEALRDLGFGPLFR